MRREKSVMLDSRMPRLDGAQILRQLRRRRSDVKVILCSGNPEHKATHGRDGLAGFLRKPYDASALLRRVHQVLGAPRQTSHAQI